MMTGVGRRRRCHRPSWCVKLLSLCLVLATAWAYNQRSMSAGERRRALEKTRQSSPGGAVIPVDDSKFDRFVAGVPRQYEAIVFFTAADPTYKCASCRSHLDEFTVLAESYKAAKEKQPEVLKGADIFFFVVDFSRNQGTFQRLGLQTVPKIVHFPPAENDGEEGRYAITDESQHMQMLNKAEAEAMARFVRKRTGASIPIVRPEPPVTLIVAGLLILAVLSIRPLISNLGLILKTIRNRYLWLSFSLTVFTFGISGGVYDIIRNPAPFHMNHNNGKITWFHPQSNLQFVAEGFIAGVLTLLCGASGIMLYQIAPRLTSGRSKNLAIGLFGTGFVFFFYQVMSLYRYKNKWYRPLF